MQVSYFLDNNCILPYAASTAAITNQCNAAYDFTGNSYNGLTLNQFSYQELLCTNPTITTSETVSINPKEIHAILAFSVLSFVLIVATWLFVAVRLFVNKNRSANEIQLTNALNPVSSTTRIQ